MLLLSQEAAPGNDQRNRKAMRPKSPTDPNANEQAGSKRQRNTPQDKVTTAHKNTPCIYPMQGVL